LNQRKPIKKNEEKLETATPSDKIGKSKLVNKYIERWKETAIQEMKLYGIPASVTLAQGILESNAGQSTLSKKYNNHFGIKWRKKGKFVIMSDDKPRDKFCVYKSGWESFRHHSKFLQGKRYKSLYKSKNYKDWCRGLKKCGYATNPKYDVLLISIIEKHQLYKYDNP